MVDKLSDALDKHSKMLDNINVPQIQAQLTALEDKFEDSMKSLENVVPTKLQEKIESSNTWAQMIRKSLDNSPPISLESLKKAVHEVAESDKERHMRDRGVVIYRVEEKFNLSEDLRKKDDEEFIKEVLHYISCDDLQKDITHLERLGKFDADKCREYKFRPIKLRFDLKDKRDRLLNSLKLLKHAPDRIKKVSIRHDLNEIQRRDWYDKIKEAREKSLESTTMIYRVRGFPDNYKIVSFPRNPSQPSNQVPHVVWNHKLEKLPHLIRFLP
jgi:hypothetical protein